MVKAAQKANKKLVVGYILRHLPSWQKFVEMSKDLGKPLVMRMNLNQQSQTDMWRLNRNLMASLKPIVYSGVNYIDEMSKTTQSTPARVSAIGARLTDAISEANYNYRTL